MSNMLCEINKRLDLKPNFSITVKKTSIWVLPAPAPNPFIERSIISAPLKYATTLFHTAVPKLLCPWNPTLILRLFLYL